MGFAIQAQILIIWKPNVVVTVIVGWFLGFA